MARIGQKICLEERLKIQKGLQDGLNFTAIGKLIDRSCQAVAREVKKRSENGIYDAYRADEIVFQARSVAQMHPKPQLCKTEDLVVGEKYGHLTLLKVFQRANPARLQQQQTMVEVQCDCGKRIIQVAATLRYEAKRERTHNRGLSCGCALSLDELRTFQWPPGRPPTLKWRRNESGYIFASVPHPTKRRQSIMEHSLVMEKYLGRPLFYGENVHHKNGVRDDNRLENLELWVTSQPSGQRPEDLVSWAKEILRRYDV